MRNGILILTLSIVCIAGFTAVVFLDNHPATVGVRNAITQFLEDSGVDVKSFWTTVDEDMIAGEGSKTEETSEMPNPEDAVISESMVREMVRDSESIAEADFVVPDDIAEYAEEIKNNGSSEIFVGDGTVVVTGGVGIEETIPANSTSEETTNTASNAPEEETEDIKALTYDQYMAMTPDEKAEFQSKWESPSEYLMWYQGILNDHRTDSSIVRKTLNSSSSIDIEAIESEASEQ